MLDTMTTIPSSTCNNSTTTIMELGEILTITAALSTTTYVAKRAKTNTEVTIRVAPPGGSCSPVLSSKRHSRIPSCKLSPLIITKSTPTKTVDIELEKTSYVKGWVMLSTMQAIPSWNIAWVSTTTTPSPKICVMMESEVTHSSSPSLFEDISSIVEVGTMSNEKSVETEEPVRFEITTSTNQYKVMTNSFMTSRMRSLMASIPSKYDSKSLSSPRDLLPLKSTQLPSAPVAANSPRASTPIPKPIVKQDKSTKDNKTSRPLKKVESKSNIPPRHEKPHPPPLVRTSTPIPDPIPTAKPTIVSRRLKTRSISLEAVPVAPVIKPAPRPVSINVYEHIKRSSDVPLAKDPPQMTRVSDKGSCLEFHHPTLIREASVIASILAECETNISARNLDCDESDFSDDGASDFSEEDNSDWDNSKNFQASLDHMQAEIRALDIMDGEVLDLCERSKGLSPVLNYGPFCDDGDDSSCFSEDDEMQGEECSSSTMDGTDGLSTENSSMCSARSSVNGSRLFDASRDLPGGLHKAVKAVKQHEKDSMRKSLKVEKDEKKRKEKEARQSARLSKKIQKKKQSEEDKTYNSNSLKQLKEEETGGAGSRLSLRLKGCVRKLFGRMGFSDEVSK